MKTETKSEQFEQKQKAMSNKELIETADRQLSEMCKSYGKTFKMSIPPSITDTDMILCELIRRFRTYAGEPK